MLNYNLNINSPLQQEKKNEDVRPPIYWSFASYASASNSSDLGERGFATMSIFAPGTNCIQVSNDNSGDFTTDAQFPVTASMTGSNWPITGSTTMSIFTSGITYDPISVNQYYFAGISASAAQISANPSLTGSKIFNAFSASEFYRWYVDGVVSHTKGNVYNPIVNWLGRNQSPTTTTGNVNGFTASFNIVKNSNESLVSLPQVTGSNAGTFNNQYALNITSSLSASIINDATGSTTMSIIIPEIGISTSSLLLNSLSAGLRTISASFTASNNNPYNITASVIMNKGNESNAFINVLTTGSTPDSYSIYTTKPEFTFTKNQNETYLNYTVTASKVDNFTNEYAFNWTASLTAGGILPPYQAFTYLTTSLIIPQIGTNSTTNTLLATLGTQFQATTDSSSYYVTASSFTNKIPSIAANVILIGKGGNGAGSTLIGGTYGGGGGAGGFYSADVWLQPNQKYEINKTSLAQFLFPNADILSASAGENGSGTKGGASGFATYNGTIIRPFLSGSTAGGGGGTYQTGSLSRNGGPQIGGGAGAGNGNNTPGTGSALQSQSFQTYSISISSQGGTGGALDTDGNAAIGYGGGGGGAGITETGISRTGGAGGGAVVILTISGSNTDNINVTNATSVVNNGGTTSYYFEGTSDFIYLYEPKPNPQEQPYQWRADTLVVAGGGAGGGGLTVGGGGGAGAYVYQPYVYYDLSKTYSIQIGNGMTGSISGTPTVTTGSNSYIRDNTTGIDIIFAKGGGLGQGFSGGSGGGGNGFGGIGGVGISGSINLNYYVSSSAGLVNRGGNSDNDFQAGGGGGGAATTGSNGSRPGGGPVPTSGAGGLGLYDLSFTPIGVAGGGMGCENAAMTGSVAFGGGDSPINGISNTGSNAPANRGGGGGGGFGSFKGGDGGSGLIQIKYNGTARATGGQIETQLVSGSYYTLHTFTASGTFTPTA